MTYGIEVNGKLFEKDAKGDIKERLDVLRNFYAGFVAPNYLNEFVKPVKIYANGQRKEIEV